MSAQQQAADKALRDRDLLYRNYRAAKRQQYEELFAIPVHGPLLRKFNSTLGHFGLEDADRMVEYVRERNRVWLKAAPEEVRTAALEMIGHRIVRIRARAGMVPFDDELPGEEPTVFTLCKQELGR